MTCGDRNSEVNEEKSQNLLIISHEISNAFFQLFYSACPGAELNGMRLDAPLGPCGIPWDQDQAHSTERIKFIVAGARNAERSSFLNNG